MTRIGFTSISFAALLLFGISVGCRAPTPKAVSVVAPEGWRLRFSDTFDRNEPGPDWYLVSGNWRIEDDTGKVLHRAADWHRSLARVEFQKPVKTRRLKLVVESTWGAPASVYAFHAHGPMT